MSDNPERPPLEIRLSNGDKVKMTYGLEMDIRRMLPDPLSAMQLALNDPFTQDYVIRRCLTKKTTMVQNPNEELITEIDPELTPEDTDKLLMWALEHVLYFFVKRTTAMTELGSKYEAALPNPSKNGSENSASTTPSAGPLE